MKHRRKARELMLKALYQYDIGKESSVDRCVEDVIDVFKPEEEVKEYIKRLKEAVEKNFDYLNEVISKYSKNWKLERMAVIDRNILRIAIAEMLYFDDIPPKVSINEAVEIAKKYSTDDSYAFINGILHRVFITMIGEEGDRS